MGICIYSEYVRQKKVNRENIVRLTDKEAKANIHKANIAMDMILEFLHQGKDIDDEEEEINLDACKLIDLVQFCRWIQKKVAEDN